MKKYSPLRHGGHGERDFEIKNLCELCVLCGESLFSDSVAAVPRICTQRLSGAIHESLKTLN